MVLGRGPAEEQVAAGIAADLGPSAHQEPRTRAVQGAYEYRSPSYQTTFNNDDLLSGRVSGTAVKRVNLVCCTHPPSSLPAIVQTFDGPPELLVSIRRELSLWKSTPSADYFSCGGPIEVLEAKLQDLHAQRYVCVIC